MYDVDGIGQVTFAELLRAMRATDLQTKKGTHARGFAGAGGKGSKAEEWLLQPYKHNQYDYLIDNSTQVRVYDSLTTALRYAPKHYNFIYRTIL